MSEESVGQIGLDLVINKGEFNKQMAGLKGVAKKAGLTLAAAFSVKKIVDFSKECIELGSDLQEIQNVVDVTFPRMSKQVDDFAKNAISSFGMSETMAKKFTGTFGAMAKAFGFSEKSAYDMSTTLTGLAGDVASFYNISQDEAFTKLKAVFSGETEGLKDLGVVMTQSALDSYALANGFGKTTKSMSEMEKVALRYQFVQDRLSASSGDFMRTSDGWANQVRVLKLQFDSLKATIGQGLINVLTPVIKVINTIIGKLMTLANAFKAFTEMITGKKSGNTASDDMDAVAGSADKAGAAMEGAGNATKKAAKDIKSATTGIDELNILSADSGGGADSEVPSGGYDAENFDMGEIDTSAIEESNNQLTELQENLKKIKDTFAKGFLDGLGDVSVFDDIQKSIEGIHSSLKGIFTDDDVNAAAGRFAQSFTENLGKVAGSLVGAGATIADNLLGGIDLYLQQNAPRIKNFFTSMFDIGSEVAEIAGDFSEAAEEIFSAFRSDSAKQITADIIGVFADAFMGVKELEAKIGRDILDVITRPFIDNKDGLRIVLEDLFKPLAEITSTIKAVVDKTMDNIGKTYDEHVRPMFDAFAGGLSSIVSVLIDAWQSHIKPVIDELAKKIGDFAENYLQPMINNVLEFAGEIADAITVLWQELIQPFIEWLIETIIPALEPIIQTIIDWVISTAEWITNAVNDVITILSGAIDFIVGVFTGDWEKAWGGIKEIFHGIWELIKTIVTGYVKYIGDIINIAWTAIKEATKVIWTAIKNLLSGLWEWLKSLAAAIFNSIKDAIAKVWTGIKTETLDIWNSLKNYLAAAWENIRKKCSEAFTGMKDTVVKAWSTLKNKTSEIWNGIWSSIRGVINKIIGGVENMVNRVISGINFMTDGFNKLAGKIPGVSDELIPSLGTVHLPRLAQGGFVRANTPQLAMIGDNRHYGEIVAPEDKMQEMVNKAVAMASQNSGMSDIYLEMMVELLKKIVDLIEQMDLTVNIDIRDVKKKLTELEKRSGYTLRTT